jgi:hypothetical protein
MCGACGGTASPSGVDVNSLLTCTSRQGTDISKQALRCWRTLRARSCDRPESVAGLVCKLVTWLHLGEGEQVDQGGGRRRTRTCSRLRRYATEISCVVAAGVTPNTSYRRVSLTVRSSDAMASVRLRLILYVRCVRCARCTSSQLREQHASVWGHVGSRAHSSKGRAAACIQPSSLLLRTTTRRRAD